LNKNTHHKTDCGWRWVFVMWVIEVEGVVLNDLLE